MERWGRPSSASAMSRRSDAISAKPAVFLDLGERRLGGERPGNERGGFSARSAAPPADWLAQRTLPLPPRPWENGPESWETATLSPASAASPGRDWRETAKSILAEDKAAVRQLQSANAALINWGDGSPSAVESGSSAEVVSGRQYPRRNIVKPPPPVPSLQPHTHSQWSARVRIARRNLGFGPPDPEIPSFARATGASSCYATPSTASTSEDASTAAAPRASTSPMGRAVTAGRVRLGDAGRHVGFGPPDAEIPSYVGADASPVAKTSPMGRAVTAGRVRLGDAGRHLGSCPHDAEIPSYAGDDASPGAKTSPMGRAVTTGRARLGDAGRQLPPPPSIPLPTRPSA